MRPIRFSSRAGSEIWPKPQSRMRLPLSVTKGSPVAVSRSLATDAQRLQPRLGHLQAEGYDLDRHRRLAPQAIDQLGAVDDDGKPPAGGRDDLLAQQGAAQPLDQVQRAALDLIGAVDGEIDLGMLGEGRERNARGLGLGPRMLGGGNAHEAQALAMAHRQRLDGESGGRAGAETHDHAVGHQLDRGLGRLALQRVAIGRCIAAHDFASPAVADLRMAAMAAA